MATAIQAKERPILFSGEMVRAILDGRKTQTRRIVKPQPNEAWHPIACERYFPAVEDGDGMIGASKKEIFGAYDEDWGVACPYGGPGDRLWVREAWAAFKPQPQRFGGDSVLAGAMMRIVERNPVQGESVIDYRADKEKTGSSFWRPSIHMPRWASRLTLELIDVRIEQVQDISTADVWAEGVQIPTAEGRGIMLDISSKFAAAKYVPDGAIEKGTLKILDHDAVIRAHFASLWESVNGAGSWSRNDWVWVIEFKRV